MIKQELGDGFITSVVNELTCFTFEYSDHLIGPQVITLKRMSQKFHFLLFLHASASR